MGVLNQIHLKNNKQHSYRIFIFLHYFTRNKSQWLVFLSSKLNLSYHYIIESQRTDITEIREKRTGSNAITSMPMLDY